MMKIIENVRVRSRGLEVRDSSNQRQNPRTATIQFQFNVAVAVAVAVIGDDNALGSQAYKKRMCHFFFGA